MAEQIAEAWTDCSMCRKLKHSRTFGLIAETHYVECPKCGEPIEGRGRRDG